MVHLSKVRKSGHPRHERRATDRASDESSISPYVYASRYAAEELPEHAMADKEMPAEVAYKMIKDELSLDGNPLLNLASFVTTYMEEPVEKLMTESMSKNFIDFEQYPQTAHIQNRCIDMIAGLLHAPTTNDVRGEEDSIGTSTVGSSEAIMLAMLAMKKRWQNRRKAEGKDWMRPNIVMSSAVQVCWEKAARYFDVEEKYVYCTDERYVIDPKTAVDLVDENTVGICAILGTTYTGQYEDVKGINDLLARRKIDCPIHVDAASGGFVAPFVNPSLVWDFQLEKVVSINVSGHKYGLVYPGIGWVFWRSPEYLPKELIFNVNYLGAEQATFTLNFSKGAPHVIGQYYQLIRLGKHGYKAIMTNLIKTADYLAEELTKMGFIIMSDGRGRGLPLVAFRLQSNDDRLYDEFALAHVLRQRGWVIPAYTMAPHSNQLKMMRIVLREDFSLHRCNLLVEDFKMALKSLEEMDEEMVKRYTQPFKKKMLLLWVITLLGVARHVQAKGVFAHFMLGNTNNYTQDEWRADMVAAQKAKIDAFAINTGYGLNGTNDLLDAAFTVAKDLDFKLFLSFDYSGDGHWPADQVLDVLKKFTPHAAWYKGSDNKPLVSTFEGAQAGGDWGKIKEKVECTFIPDWSSLHPDIAMGRGPVDGLMSWEAWPNGTSEMTTDKDMEYMKVLNGKPYIMPVSPWFYTNMVRYHKNWVWQGDDLWYKRWEQVLEVDPEYVEIISWNDFGESHYVGPIHDDSLGVFYWSGAPFDYAKDMPHDGWREFLPYIIDLWKNGGKDAEIETEGLVSWYRINPAASCNSGKTTGNTEMQNQDTVSPEDVLKDQIFYSALLDVPADVMVSIDGKNRTATWGDKPDGGKGIYHGNIPIDGGMGEVVITLSRDDEVMAQIKGHPITDDCVMNMTNWNPWVGSAESTAKRRPSSSSSKDGGESASSRVVLGGLTQVFLGWMILFFALS
ncbi:hypothetical protein FE257_007346 [Aspergillus nanangensis]|uniref:Glutamate decarboxylase n=1 Tax=Aspergillus nanangensis TaxID=2582783 RepID=A0AAD4CMV1_ASPNN|nr:hypothetical protein FE257_007346 [Aspergillus nanangensis]